MLAVFAGVLAPVIIFGGVASDSGKLVVLGVAMLVGVTVWAAIAYNKSHAAKAAAAERDRQASSLDEKQRRAKALGPANAALVESVIADSAAVAGTEAAQKGWLGEVDFSDDIRAVVDNFEKAHALRQLVDQLSALDKPTANDRKIIAEAKTTAAKLEGAALARVELVGQCAAEARLIDKSLRDERMEARTATERAELNAKLGALLYGIDATTQSTPRESAAVDAVMSRVEAYREIKGQIQQAREG